MTSPGSDPGQTETLMTKRKEIEEEEERGGIWATALSVFLPETEPGLSSVSIFDSSA